MTKIAGYGSISQRHGSADPDPDPHQNVMDPEHWLHSNKISRYLKFLVNILKEGCFMKYLCCLVRHCLVQALFCDTAIPGPTVMKQYRTKSAKINVNFYKILTVLPPSLLTLQWR